MHDAQGNLRWTQVDGNSTTEITIVHDIAGNKTSIVDPNAGSRTFSYDALGQVLTATDAKAQVTTSVYDLLGRLESRTDADGASTWVYDTRTNGLGLLASKASTNFVEDYFYDSLSRLDYTETRLMGATTPYTMDYGFDDFSRVASTSYPSGFVAEDAYNPYGYLASTKQQGAAELLWQVRQQDNYGNTVFEHLGNGLGTARIYNATSGRLETISTGSRDQNGDLADVSIQSLDYQFDTLGNLYQRASTRNGTENLIEAFTYDALNRLETADTTGLASGIRNQSYAYDNLGNITSKGGNTYSYGSQCTSGFGPHAVCEISGNKNTSYGYDANGNMTSGDGRTIAYSAADKPTSITKGSTVTEFTYGPDRTRFYRKTSGNGNTVETYYLAGGSFEVVVDQNASEVKQKSYIGGIAVHIDTDDLVLNTNITEELLYLHRDHLGSTESMTDTAGALVERMAFDAYGSRREGSWEDAGASYTATLPGLTSLTTTEGFTGHEMVDEVGLIHMNGRMYDPELGRFLSTDPYVQAPYFSQSYNRYSYVWNNPLSFTDPTGYQVLYGDLNSYGGSSYYSSWDYGFYAPTYYYYTIIYIVYIPVVQVPQVPYVPEITYTPQPLETSYDRSDSDTNGQAGELVTNAATAMGGATQYWGNTVTSNAEYVYANPGEALLTTASVIADTVFYYGDVLVLNGLGLGTGADVRTQRRILGMKDSANRALANLKEAAANGNYRAAGGAAMAVVMAVLPRFVTKSVTPKNVQQFESKRAGFRAAKRDAGIPTSQTHTTHTKNLKADGLDTRRTATEYDFGGGRKIQDHPAGHKFPDGGVYDKSHFNNHGSGGTKGHYEY